MWASEHAQKIYIPVSMVTAADTPIIRELVMPDNREVPGPDNGGSTVHTHTHTCMPSQSRPLTTHTHHRPLTWSNGRIISKQVKSSPAQTKVFNNIENLFWFFNITKLRLREKVRVHMKASWNNDIALATIIQYTSTLDTWKKWPVSVANLDRP